MLNLTLLPHRASLPTTSVQPQKVFVLGKLRVEAGEVPRSGVQALLLMDTSGSMADLADLDLAQQNPGAEEHWRSRIEWAVEAVHRFIDAPQAGSEDRLGIIRFDQDAEIVLRPSPWTERAEAHQAADRLRKVRGETAMARALALSWDMLEGRRASGGARVLLLTDGDTHDAEECRTWMRRLAAINVPVVAVGIGVDYREDLLLEFTARTGGRTHHLSRMADLDGILERELAELQGESVTGLQLVCAPSPGVTLESCTLIVPQIRELPIEDEVVSLGCLPAGASPVFITEWSIHPEALQAPAVLLAEIVMQGTETASGRKFAVEPIELSIQVDDRSAGDLNEEVMGYVRQKAVDRMLGEAVTLQGKNPTQALQKLTMAQDTVLRLGNRNIQTVLQRARTQLEKTGRLDPGLAKELKITTRGQTIMLGDQTLSEVEVRRLTGA